MVVRQLLPLALFPCIFELGDCPDAVVFVTTDQLDGWCVCLAWNTADADATQERGAITNIKTHLEHVMREQKELFLAIFQVHIILFSCLFLLFLDTLGASSLSSY